MKLYDADFSGNCYKIRLFLALLALPYERITVDLQAGETRRPEILSMNPRAQVPILVDDAAVIWDSQAILVYVARQYGGEPWLPTDPVDMASVMQWLAVSENELLYGLARARRILLLGAPGDLAEAQTWGNAVLKLIDTHLQNREWLARGWVTIADIACYPYIKLAPQAGVGLDDYPFVRRWMERIEGLQGYVPLEG